MSSYFRIAAKPGALLLLMTALFLVIAQIFALMIALREKRRGPTAGTALHLAVGFVLFVFMLEAYEIVNFPDIPRRTRTEVFLFDLPWLVYVGLEAVSALLLIRRFEKYRRYRKNTVTPEAIRQTVDLLPEGICVSAPDGTVLLANLKMDALCRDLTGERLFDARRLWEQAERVGEAQGDGLLVHSSREEVWLFAREPITADGRKYLRTSAAQVTQRYRMTEELREKNVHLRDIQRRMKEASELSGEMFVELEEANARTALHNQLGQVLLMGRHWLEHPESADAGMVALLTRQMNRFLLGENTGRKQEEADTPEQAIRLAGSIGVAVELTGELPRGPQAGALLFRAIRECAANAVKHAGGSRLWVAIEPAAGGSRISFTNNGRPPKGPVAESGGLLALRRGAEALGGRMEVQSAPRFELTLYLPET